MDETDWHAPVRGMLKVDITRWNMTYDQLSAKLPDIGVSERSTNLRTKISLGEFSIVFFEQCLRAPGPHTIHLEV